MSNRNYIFCVILLALFGCYLLSSCDQSGFSHGKRLYDDYCESCHMEKGEGLASLIPALDSDYYRANTKSIPCIIKNGMEGSISVNGKKYNQAMPANKKLSATDITNIINYIDNSLLKSESFTSVATVQQRLEACEH